MASRNEAETQHISYGIVLLIFAAVAFLGIHQRALWEPDEGRYAVISLNMSSASEWFIPIENGFAYLDKPPMAMWLTAVMYRLLGAEEWVSRIFSWISAVWLLFLTVYFSRQIEPRFGPVVHLSILGSNVLWIAFATIFNLDMMIAAAVSTSLAIYWTGKDSRGMKRILLRILFWLSMTFGFFVKGLIAYMLPLGIIVLFCLSEQRYRELRWLVSPVGIVTSIAIIIPWALKIEEQIPGFMWYFFLHEHFTRYLSDVHDRNYFFLIYVGIIFIGFLPWSIRIFYKSFWTNMKTRYKEHALVKFMMIWFVVVIVFFTLGKSRLPGYILPALLPAVLLFGDKLTETHKLHQGFFSWYCLIIVLAIFMFGIYVNILFDDPMALYLSIPLLLTLILNDYLKRSVRWLNDSQVQVFALALFFSCGWFLTILGLSKWDELNSTRQLALRITSASHTRLPVIVFNNFPRTLPFYLGYPVLLTSPMGENIVLSYVSKNNPSEIISETEVIDRVQRSVPLFVLCHDKETKNLVPFTLKKTALYLGKYGDYHLYKTAPKYFMKKLKKPKPSQ